MPKLSEAEIERALEQIEGWSHRGDEIVREFEFRDFVDAVGFMARVGVLAERANHHPHLSNVYNLVTIALSTHDAGGITDRDVELAAEIDERAQN